MTGLMPGALAAWATALTVGLALAHGAPPEHVARAALTFAAVASACAVLAIRGRRWGPAAATAIAAAALISSASYASSMDVEPLRSAGSTVTVEASIVGDMRLRDSGPVPVLDVRAHARRITTPEGEWLIGAPVLLRLPSEAAPPIGAIVNVTGVVRPADPLRGLAARIDARGVDIIEAPGPLGAMANSVRHALGRSLDGAPPRAAALVEGLAVGDETGQPRELAEQMRISGLSHLTAVSGGNTSIVVGAALLIATLLGLGLVSRVVVAGVALGAFVVIVGPQPSVLRASVMGLVALLAVITGARRTGLHALAFAIVVLLVLSPGLATAWGFALSAAATAGLVVLAAPVVARWGGEGRVRRALVGACALTIGAQVATLPLIAAFGDGLSLVAVPANVLAAPAVAPVTVLGLLAAIAGTVSMPVGTVLARGAEPFAAWIAWVAESTSSWPAATLPWPGGIAGAGLAAIVAVAVGRAIARHRGRHERVASTRVIAVGAVLISAVAVLALRLPERAGWPPPDWIMVACDVGQGDALVLRGDTGGAIVVDAGPDPRAVDQCLSDLGLTRIDLLVLSHHHADHVDGVPGILAGREVRSALVSPLDEPIEQSARVRTWLSGAPVLAAKAGQRYDVDGISISVLWPQRIIRGPESAPNNASVVLLVESRGVRILLLGDVEVAAQVALRTSSAGPGVDVVKIAHHGSRYQDPALAAWTSARIALISVGRDNRYGHPAPETLRGWLDSGALVARTDEAGDVAIVGPRLGVVTRRGASG